jgi:hypothetical protein
MKEQYIVFRLLTTESKWIDFKLNTLAKIASFDSESEAVEYVKRKEFNTDLENGYTILKVYQTNPPPPPPTISTGNLEPKAG